MNIQLLEISEKDESFTKELFFDNKIKEFQSLVGTGMLESIMEMQFMAQQNYYKSQFPEAQNYIVYLNKNPIGKLVLTISDSYHIVDISILSQQQANGIGTNIINSIISEATVANKSVKLTVARINPALKLYLKLGFKIVDEDEVCLYVST